MWSGAGTKPSAVRTTRGDRVASMYVLILICRFDDGYMNAKLLQRYPLIFGHDKHGSTKCCPDGKKLDITGLKASPIWAASVASNWRVMMNVYCLMK